METVLTSSRLYTGYFHTAFPLFAILSFPSLSVALLVSTDRRKGAGEKGEVQNPPSQLALAPAMKRVEELEGMAFTRLTVISGFLHPPEQ